MIARASVAAVFAAAFAGFVAAATQSTSPVASDYFGATPPEHGPEIFAPGIVSRPERFGARIAFSPDNQECYLTETDATFSHPKLLMAHRAAQGWSDFVPVPFAAKFKVCHEPFVSDDNQRLYFTADGDDAVPTNRRDFWKVEREGKGWGEPTRLAAPLNSEAGEFYYNESSDGTVVFASDRADGQGDFDLYRVENSADGTMRAVAFAAPVNTPGPEYDPCISSDGRFMIFATARDGAHHLDLYVTYREGPSSWTTPVPLKGEVNTPANEYAPTLTRDGRYLFFVRHDGKQSDLYWVATAEVLPK